jgi:hypothetical protein
LLTVKLADQYPITPVPVSAFKWSGMESFSIALDRQTFEASSEIEGWLIARQIVTILDLVAPGFLSTDSSSLHFRDSSLGV